MNIARIIQPIAKAGLFASTTLYASVSIAALTYTQDFEGMSPTASGPSDLEVDGWQVGANVFDPTGTTFFYNYFAFPAPQGTGAFSDVATGEGGVDQGNNQFSVYSDYNNNAEHTNGNLVNSVIFKDIGLLDASDVGTTYTFSFDAKQGNMAPPSTGLAYIKTLDTLGGSFATLGQTSLDTSAVGTNWISTSLALTIDASWVGQTLQIGFENTATNFNGSSNFYDNLNVNNIPVPGAVWLFATALAGLSFYRKNQ